MDARGPSDAVDGRAPGDPEDAPEVGELPAPREAMNDIEPAAAVEPAEPIAERYARLGADGLRRLRARYADLKVRLAARDLEAADRAVVTEQLERLNPDGWRSEQEVGLALEQYEAIYDAVRPIVGHPRRPRA